MTKTLSNLDNNSRNEMFRRLSCQYINPESELDFKNPFELLCAVVLSAQATDASVNLVTPYLFEKAPDPEKMAALGADEIGKIIKSVGLWKNKSQNLVKLSLMLTEKYGGNVPQSYEELIKLPGVGSKTAKVVLNVAFHVPTIAVDTHIFRVSRRTGLCPGKTVKEVEENIVPLIDEQYLLNAHHYLLLHGRYVCTARKPDCENCCIKDLCLKLTL